MKNKKRWIALAIIILLVGGCFGDRMVASVVFQHYCKTLPGLYVYEKVELGDEYFLPRPQEGTIEARKLSNEWVYDEQFQFNKRLFEKKYRYVFQEVSRIYNFGPIFKYRAFIVRIEDEKVLSEAISLTNRKGWFSGADGLLFSQRRDDCPSGKSDFNIPYFGKHQINLIRETFRK